MPDMSRLPMPVRRTIALTVLLALTAGCGGSGVSAKAWWEDVCGGLVKWQNVLTEQPEIPQNDLVAAKTATTDLLTLAVTSTDELIRTIDQAGEPDVKGGADIAREYKKAIGGVRDALTTVKTSVEGLDPNDQQKFLDGMAAIGTDFQQAVQATGAAFDAIGKKYKSSELNRAASEVEACKEVAT
jgi:hypothetical protein